MLVMVRQRVGHAGDERVAGEAERTIQAAAECDKRVYTEQSRDRCIDS